MSLKITHKYSTAAGTPPAAGDIDVGELAINAADAALYLKDTEGSIKNAVTDAPFSQAGAGTIARTVESKLRDVVSVKDFGAVGDGVTDDTGSWSLFAAADGVKIATGEFLVDGQHRQYQEGFLGVGRVQVSDTDWDIYSDPTYARSTPETALMALGGHYDELGSAGRNYKWGIESWMTNPGTMALTNVDTVSQGWKVRGVGATARQIGADGDGHALEVLSGQLSAQAKVLTTAGSNVLTVESILIKGSRFCIGDNVDATNIPSGAVITAVTKDGATITGNEVLSVDVASGGSGYVVGDVVTVNGGTYTFPAQARVRTVSGGSITSLLVINGGNYTSDPVGAISLAGGTGTGATVTAAMITAGYGNPDTITIDVNATGSGSNITAKFISTVDNMNIGILVTGSGDGGTDESGNPNGRGIQFQSYGNAAFKYGIVYGPSALRSDGSGILFTNATSDTGLLMESSALSQGIKANNCTMTNFLQIANSAFSGSCFGISNSTAQNGINFTSSNTFSGAAIFLQGQDIDTDLTLGMKIGKGATRKIGFWGATPVNRPGTIPDATDAASTQTRLNQLLAAMRTIGLIAS